MCINTYSVMIISFNLVYTGSWKFTGWWERSRRWKYLCSGDKLKEISVDHVLRCTHALSISVIGIAWVVNLAVFPILRNSWSVSCHARVRLVHSCQMDPCGWKCARNAEEVDVFGFLRKFRFLVNVRREFCSWTYF